MSGKGNCYDNAVVETFFKTIKSELIWRTVFMSRSQAETAMAGYIDGFYNPVRRHSTLDFTSPVKFEAEAMQTVWGASTFPGWVQSGRLSITATICLLRSTAVGLTCIAIAIAGVSSTAAAEPSEDFYRAAAYDYSLLTSDRYEGDLTTRTADIGAADATMQLAKGELDGARTELNVAVSSVSTAWNGYLAAIASGSDDALREAWSAVGPALHDYRLARDLEKAKASALTDARGGLTFKRFWKAQLENNWREAQAARDVEGAYTVAEDIARCRPGAGRVCSASGLLISDTRFTVLQPALSAINVHHAHAKGLSGAGVRVAIEDDAVNYMLPEFSGRVSFEGARIVYPRPFATSTPEGAKSWSYTSQAYQPYDTEDPYIHESLTADVIVRLEQDWTKEIWLENQHEDVLQLDRWVVIPPVESATAGLSHGTRVASVAVGRDFGVAPGATLIPIFKDFSASAQTEQSTWSRYLLRLISVATPAGRRVADEYLAKSVRADYANYDVVNRSFGIGVFDPAAIEAVLEDGTNWWGEGLRRLLPLTWRAYMQTDVHPDDRAVVVYAAGNSQEERGGLGADLPKYELHVRGHHLAVMAIDDDGKHSFYTNFCGPLPADWDASRWGRHFCLAAPGTVNAVSNRPGYAFQGTEGTSFAAPIVTGAVALLIEHFRGQLGNTEIAKRLVNTANNGGRYAQAEIYGAGLLDLDAALRPVGITTTGTKTLTAPSATTKLKVPAAFGNVADRIGNIEVASLDTMGAPFWAPAATYLRSSGHTVVAIPGFQEAWATSNEFNPRVHLGFTTGTVASPLSSNGLHILAGPGRGGIEQISDGEGLHWGMMVDTESWMGGTPSGGFGNTTRSSTAWVGRDSRFDLGDGWAFEASGTLALGQTQFAPGAMLIVEPSMMSAWNIDVVHAAGEGWSRLRLSQPLRAESGRGTFTYLAGLAEGKPAYDQIRFPLAPAGREVELSFTHQVPLSRGTGVFELAHAIDADHTPGQSRSRIGMAYRLRW